VTEGRDKYARQKLLTIMGAWNLTAPSWMQANEELGREFSLIRTTIKSVSELVSIP
jgi:hypothetical protein